MIDGDDFAKAMQCEKARKLIEEGLEYARQLQMEGRDHSIPGGLLHNTCPHCGREI